MGNGYILTHNGEHLLLECGIPFDKYLQALNYDVASVAGCVVSHRHQDHAEYIPQMRKFCIDVYSCADVCQRYNGVMLIGIGRKQRIGNFIVQPIPLNHSVENYGYLIICPDGHRIVFATDCNSFTARIKNINTWLIEANYDEEIVMELLLKDHTIRSHYVDHLEIKSTIKALVDNHSASLSNIVLLHLSNGHSNAKQFCQRVQNATYCDNVVVADVGMEIPLASDEF